MIEVSMYEEDYRVPALKKILAAQKEDGSWEPSEDLALYLGANSVDDLAVPEGIPCSPSVWTTLLFCMILEEPRNGKYNRMCSANVDKAFPFIVDGLKAVGITDLKEFARVNVGPVYANWSREPKVRDGRFGRLSTIVNLQKEDGSYEESQDLAEALGANSIDDLEAPEDSGFTQALWVTGIVAGILESNWLKMDERVMWNKAMVKMTPWFKAEVTSQGVSMDDFGRLAKERVKDWRK